MVEKTGQTKEVIYTGTTREIRLFSICQTSLKPDLLYPLFTITSTPITGSICQHDSTHAAHSAVVYEGHKLHLLKGPRQSISGGAPPDSTNILQILPDGGLGKRSILICNQLDSSRTLCI